MKYFSESEFSCKCCGKNNAKHELKVMLDTAREEANIPFVINSGCRCEKHNKTVGGRATSSHLNGTAVDLRVRNSRERHIILEALIYAGFKRIGIADSFIHVDIDKSKSQRVIWTY